VVVKAWCILRAAEVVKRVVTVGGQRRQRRRAKLYYSHVFVEGSLVLKALAEIRQSSNDNPAAASSDICLQLATCLRIREAFVVSYIHPNKQFGQRSLPRVTASTQ
jgi:hypothetical protein